MRVSLVDPSAFTPPYDRSLAAALARVGVEVELHTSRFLYGPVPAARGYAVHESFYRRTSSRGRDSRLRLASKAIEHVPDMLRFARRPQPDLIHWQWATLPAIDGPLISRAPGPRVLTLHYPLPRPGRAGALRRQRRFLSRFDAVVVHTKHGARRLREDVGLDPARIEVIPHGPLDYLCELPEQPLPDELAAVERPVVLFFGLLRPYKGIDALIEAFGELDGAELWIAGMPRMPLEQLRTLAEQVPGTVRFIPRFIADPEIPALMRRADVLALPYRDIEQSGVLYTGLAFGKPMVLSDVGGFGELARDHGAAALVPPDDPPALAAALSRLLGDREQRQRLAARARAAVEGPYSWDAIAARTVDLYRRLLAGHR